MQTPLYLLYLFLTGSLNELVHELLLFYTFVIKQPLMEILVRHVCTPSAVCLTKHGLHSLSLILHWVMDLLS